MYVWGRSRLPTVENVKHKLAYVPSMSDKIPEAHTCYFSLDLGNYESMESLKNLLIYGMEHCKEITEGGRIDLGAQFGLVND